MVVYRFSVMVRARESVRVGGNMTYVLVELNTKLETQFIELFVGYKYY